MKYSYTKMFAIWFTAAVGMAFIVFAVAILPGVNLPGIPLVTVLTTAVHLGIFFWIMWTFINEPDLPTLEEKGGYTNHYDKPGIWHSY
jgi:hypothetical protein